MLKRLMGMKMGIRLGIALFLLGLLSLSGCASLGMYNPATGRKEFIFIGVEDEVAMGVSMHQKILEQYPLSKNTALVERVNRLGQRLALVSDRQDYTYKFFVLESKELNAFTTPGGYVYIFTGLIEKLKADDDIAAVLAHEIGHCAAKHIVKKYQAALGYNLFQSLLLSALSKSPQGQGMVTLGSNITTQLVFSAFSRNDEYEADRLGVKYIDNAGFDVYGVVRAFEMLQRESQGSRPILYLSTHPYIEDRIAAVKKIIEQLRQLSLRKPVLIPEARA